MLKGVAPEVLEQHYGKADVGYLHRTDKTTWRYVPPLNAKEQRFLNVIVDGTRRVTDMPTVSGLPHRQGTFRAAAFLRAFGLVAFQPQSSAAKQDAAPSLESELARLKGLDAFSQLGAHWSEHPRLLEQRYRDLVRKFGLGSQAAQRSPATCAGILKVVENAWRMLSAPEGRRAVRSALGEQDYHAAADILVKHAEIAHVRMELEEMLRALEVAAELYPSQENRGLLQRAQEVMRHRSQRGQG
jgi:hypothetical protein